MMTNAQAALIAASTIYTNDYNNTLVQGLASPSLDLVFKECLGVLEKHEQEPLATPEPQPEPPTFAVGTRVRYRKSEGVITHEYPTGHKYRVKFENSDGHTRSLLFEPHELEPLSEPAALPEGVTGEGDTWWMRGASTGCVDFELKSKSGAAQFGLTLKPGDISNLSELYMTNEESDIAFKVSLGTLDQIIDMLVDARTEWRANNGR